MLIHLPSAILSVSYHNLRIYFLQMFELRILPRICNCMFYFMYNFISYCAGICMFDMHCISVYLFYISFLFSLHLCLTSSPSVASSQTVFHCYKYDTMVPLNDHFSTLPSVVVPFVGRDHCTSFAG